MGDKGRFKNNTFSVKILALLATGIFSLLHAAASGQGSQPGAADYRLGLKYETAGEYPAAYGPYKRAANAGNAEAAFRIGNFYEEGKLGTSAAESNAAVKTAYPWYVKAAQNGNASAQLLLAQWLLNGKGTICAKNPIGALPYLRQASRQRDKLSVQNQRWVDKSLQYVQYIQQQQSAAATQAGEATVQAAAQNQAFEAQTTQPAVSREEWEQDHQNKIDELNQQIEQHEQQADEDDQNAEQAAEAANQTTSATGVFAAIATAIHASMATGLAQKYRNDAAQERQEEEEEQQQLAELIGEQPGGSSQNFTTGAQSPVQAVPEQGTGAYASIPDSGGPADVAAQNGWETSSQPASCSDWSPRFDSIDDPQVLASLRASQTQGWPVSAGYSLQDQIANTEKVLQQLQTKFATDQHNCSQIGVGADPAVTAAQCHDVSGMSAAMSVVCDEHQTRNAIFALLGIIDLYRCHAGMAPYKYASLPPDPVDPYPAVGSGSAFPPKPSTGPAPSQPKGPSDGCAGNALNNIYTGIACNK